MGSRVTSIQWCSGIVLVVCLALGAGCGGQNPQVKMNPEDRLALATREFEGGKYLKVIPHFESLILNYPGSPEARESQYLLGECYYRTEQFDLAREEYRRLIRDYPASEFRDDAQLKVGVCFFDESLPPEYDQEMTWKAMEEFDVFLADYPVSPLREEAERLLNLCRDKIAEKHYLNANLYLKMGSPEAARHTFGRVAVEFPSSVWAARAALGIARTYLKEKNRQEAQAALGRVIQEYSGTPEAQRARETLEELEEVPAPRG